MSRAAKAPIGLVLLTAATLMLPACGSDLVQAVPGVMKLNSLLNSDPVDLAKVDYAAADQLAYQSNANISRDTEITVTKLYDMNNVHSDVIFAYVVPQHVGTRLAQLGYNVRLAEGGEIAAVTDVTPSGNDRIRGWKRQKAVLGGSYRAEGSDVHITLRLVETPTDKLLGAYEYKVRRTSAIGKMLLPAAAQASGPIPVQNVAPVPLQSEMDNSAMPDEVVRQAIPDNSQK